MSRQTEQSTEKYDSIFSLFVQVFWRLFGNALAFFSLLAILNHKGKMFYTYDIVFWCMIAALISARFIDFKIWGGVNEKNEPITIGHCKKYTKILLVIAFISWLISHLINYLFINK
jgi:hypothetical protein